MEQAPAAGRVSMRRSSADKVVARDGDNEADPPQLLVPASFVFKALDDIEEFKGFLMYGAFFLLFVVMTTYRVDWIYGVGDGERWGE